MSDLIDGFCDEVESQTQKIEILETKKKVVEEVQKTESESSEELSLHVFDDEITKEGTVAKEDEKSDQEVQDQGRAPVP